MGKVQRNFVGEKNLSRTAASYNAANAVVKSKNQGSIKSMANSIKILAEFASQEFELKNLVKLTSENMKEFAEYLKEL